MNGLIPDKPDVHDNAGDAGDGKVWPSEKATANNFSSNMPSGLLAKIGRLIVPAVLRHASYRVRHRVEQAIKYESEVGTGFLMLPVAFGVGALIYFSLPREPLLVAVLIAAALSAILASKTYGRLIGNFAMVAAFVFAGMAVGKLRSDLLDTNMIERSIKVRLSGVVVNREVRANGRQRYTIAVRSFDNYQGPVPGKVRVTAHAKYQRIDIGEPITGLAQLRPPSGPALPGGYDFAFQAWFKGIGGNGFFLGSPKPSDITTKFSTWTAIGISIAKFRGAIGQRIRDALPGESGSLAAALIVGDRSGISEPTNEALRRSGLAHILAISGLHMALVTATIILLVRGSLALIPGIALYYPIRKWAALAALVVASAYLVISGAGIATQRAWIMIAIMLLAILSDRRALTMRNVALAALVVLAWRPESIVSPSFQMSFAAVAALIAVYEGWARYRQNRHYQPPANRWWGWAAGIGKSLSGLAVTSLVAGLATGLFAAYHFYRIAPLGLLANLAAMPVVSLAVMPMALAAMVLMPFGLEAGPLVLMGTAIDEVVAVANQVANIGIGGNTGFMPLASLVLGAVALVIATQLKSVLRLSALPVAALAVLVFFGKTTPDIVISQSGGSVAIVDAAGEMHLLNPRKEKFITKIWRKALAPNQPLDKKSAAKNGSSPFRCDALGCAAMVKGGLLLSIPKRPEAFRQDCRRADIIVSKFVVPGWCSKPRLIIDRNILNKRGALTVYISQATANEVGASGKPVVEVKSALGRFQRPWSRHRQ